MHIHGQYDEALLDAERAIDLDPTYMKAYMRKCHALSKLGDEQGEFEVSEFVLLLFRCEKRQFKELPLVLLQ